jgi:hypothetical protein
MLCMLVLGHCNSELLMLVQERELVATKLQQQELVSGKKP